MKKSVPAILIVFLLATFAQAAATLTPGTVYETTKAWQTIDVNNYKGASIITKVKADSPLLTITNAENYTGWTTTHSNTTAEWKDGSIETNTKSAVFEFQASAPTVTTDTSTTITITLDTTATVYNITILNDATPPNITSLTPNGYAKANNPTQTISVTAEDAETAVASATYSFNDCSGNNTAVSLTKTNNTFTGTANFASYDEGEKACYTITATNTPGETGTTTGELLFDGTAPTVTLNTPTAFALETTDFKFTASDNIAPTLDCTLKLDAITLTTTTATNGTEKTLTIDLSNYSEGSHTWSVTCTDAVGLSTTHAQAIILDTKPPVISTTYNPFIPRTQTKTFTATITDTIGITTVTAIYDGSNVTLTPAGNDYTGSISSTTLGNKTLTITATDNVGHVTTDTKTITIIPNHQLTLTLSPSSAKPGDTITATGTLNADGSLADDEVTIKTPTGDYTETLDANNEYSQTFTAPSAGTYTITTEYQEAGYTYKAESTLTITNSQAQSNGGSSNGYDSNWNGGAGYVKPDEQQESDSDNQNQQTEEETPEEQTPPAEYEPLPAEEPREGLVPQSTGVFNLGGTIKWIAILLALALIGGLGTYAWKNRPPRKEDDGIDWHGYFKGDGA